MREWRSIGRLHWRTAARCEWSVHSTRTSVVINKRMTWSIFTNLCVDCTGRWELFKNQCDDRSTEVAVGTEWSFQKSEQSDVRRRGWTGSRQPIIGYYSATYETRHGAPMHEMSEETPSGRSPDGSGVRSTLASGYWVTTQVSDLNILHGNQDRHARIGLYAPNIYIATLCKMRPESKLGHIHAG